MLVGLVSLIAQSSIHTIQLGLVRSGHQTSVGGSSFLVSGIVIGDGDLHRSAITLGQSQLVILNRGIGQISSNILAILIAHRLIDDTAGAGHNRAQFRVIGEEDTFRTRSRQDNVALIVFQLANIISHDSYPPI